VVFSRIAHFELAGAGRQTRMGKSKSFKVELLHRCLIFSSVYISAFIRPALRDQW
jgi:hypothetical protein